MSKYFLTTDSETDLVKSGINPDYVNAMIEVAYNEKLYSKQENLPDILKQFISIAKEKGLDLKIKYGLRDNAVGFQLEINGKGEFIEDWLVEDKERHQQGVDWFNNSLKTTFGV